MKETLETYQLTARENLLFLRLKRRFARASLKRAKLGASYKWTRAPL
jgi:hypothetical protein